MPNYEEISLMELLRAVDDCDHAEHVLAFHAPGTVEAQARAKLIEASNALRQAVVILLGLRAPLPRETDPSPS